MKDINDKLNSLKQIQIPRRKALLYALTGSLGLILVPSVYASHAQKTNITEQIGEFNRITVQDYMELEQIDPTNVSNPPANRTKIILDDNDDILKRKQPDGSVINLTDTDDFLLLDGTRAMTGDLKLESTNKRIIFGSDGLTYFDSLVSSLRFFTDFNGTTANRRGTINRYWSEVAFEFETMYYQQRNVTTPPALADHSSYYAQDVAGSSEGFVIDEAGNTTQLSAHRFTDYNPSLLDKYPFTFYHKNAFLGIEQSIDMSKMVRLIEGLTGEKLMYEKTFSKTNWQDDQERQKQVIENKIKEDMIEEEMKKEIEISKDEALISIPITIEVYTNELEDEFNIDTKTGELIQYKVKKKQLITSGNKYVLKENIRFDKKNGKFFMRKTRELAEQSITVPSYKLKLPPKWLKDRDVN